MPDNETRFLQLVDHHSPDHEGNPKPIAEATIAIATPRMTAKGDVTEESHLLTIRQADTLGRTRIARIIPNTRIIETTSHEVAAALLSGGQCEEIDAPSKAHIAEHEKHTRAHVDALSKRDKQVAAGNEPAPDATDQPDIPAVIESSTLTTEEATA